MKTVGALMHELQQIHDPRFAYEISDLLQNGRRVERLLAEYLSMADLFILHTEKLFAAVIGLLTEDTHRALNVLRTDPFYDQVVAVQERKLHRSQQLAAGGDLVRAYDVVAGALRCAERAPNMPHAVKHRALVALEEKERQRGIAAENVAAALATYQNLSDERDYSHSLLTAAEMVQRMNASFADECYSAAASLADAVSAECQSLINERKRMEEERRCEEAGNELNQACAVLQVLQQDPFYANCTPGMIAILQVARVSYNGGNYEDAVQYARSVLNECELARNTPEALLHEEEKRIASLPEDKRRSFLTRKANQEATQRALELSAARYAGNPA